MSEENLAIARRYESGVHTEHFAATADEVLDANVVLRGPALHQNSIRGREGYKSIMARYQTGFPDRKNTAEDWIVEGDRVVSRTKFEATHTGPYPGIPTTGKHVKITNAFKIMRIVDGRIMHIWSFADALGMLQQLGALPQAPKSAISSGGNSLTGSAPSPIATHQPKTPSVSALPEQNKALARLFYQELDKRNLSIIDEIMAPNYRFYRPAPSQPLDRDGYRQIWTDYAGTAFPDLHHIIEEQVADEHKVMNRLVLHGTHKGTFQGIPPWGEKVTIAGASIFRIADGKIVEHWVQFDALGLFHQLGVIPSPVWMPE